MSLRQIPSHLARRLEDLFDLFRDTVWREFVQAGQPAEQWPRVQQAVERVQPVASQAMLATFRIAMGQAVDAAMLEDAPIR